MRITFGIGSRFFKKVLLSGAVVASVVAVVRPGGGKAPDISHEQTSTGRDNEPHPPVFRELIPNDHGSNMVSITVYNRQRPDLAASCRYVLIVDAFADQGPREIRETASSRTSIPFLRTSIAVQVLTALAWDETHLFEFRIKTRKGWERVLPPVPVPVSPGSVVVILWGPTAALGQEVSDQLSRLSRSR
jgi:hypothetical protein